MEKDLKRIEKMRPEKKIVSIPNINGFQFDPFRSHVKPFRIFPWKHLGEYAGKKILCTHDICIETTVCTYTEETRQ